MTTAQTPEGHPPPLEDTILFYRFVTVLRTRWAEPTRWWQCRRDHSLVQFD